MLLIFIFASFSTVAGQTWLNIAQTNFNSQCTCASEDAANPCTGAIDDNSTATWQTSDLTSQSTVYINISLHEPFSVGRVEFKQLPDPTFKKPSHVTIRYSNAETEYHVYLQKSVDLQSFPMTLGSEVDSFRIDFLTYHDYSGGTFRTGMAAIRALAKYDDVRTIDGDICQFPYYVGSEIHNWCTSYIDPSSSSNNRNPSCYTSGGTIKQCSKPVLVDVAAHRPASCSSYFNGNFVCEYGNDNDEGTEWAIDQYYQPKNVSVALEDTVSIWQIEILNRNTTVLCLDNTTGVNWPCDQIKKVEFNIYNGADNLVPVEFTPLNRSQMSRYILWETSECVYGNRVDIDIKEFVPEHPGIRELKIMVLNNTENHCHRCNGVSVYHGPPNIDRRWCEMQDLCYDKTARRCLGQVCPAGNFGPGCNQSCNCQNTTSCHPVSGPFQNCTCIGGYYKDTIANSLLCEKGAQPTNLSINQEKVNEGQVSHIICKARGFPPPDISLHLAHSPAVNIGKTSQETVSSYWVKLGRSTNISCIASNPEGVGVVSLAAQVYLLPELMSALQIYNISSQSMNVKWSPWKNTSDSGDGPALSYTLVCGETATFPQDCYHVTHSDSVTEYSANIDELKANTTYYFGIKVQRPGVGGLGPVSQTYSAQTLEAQPSGPTSPDNNSAGAVIGGVVGGLVALVIIVIILVVLLRRKNHKVPEQHVPLTHTPLSPMSHTDNDTYVTPVTIGKTNAPPVPGKMKAAQSSPYYNTSAYENVGKLAVKMEDLAGHIARLKENKNKGYKAEFESLPADAMKGVSHKIAKTKENNVKNRFRNIVPYDHSRVELHCSGGESDYINASHIQGYSRSYIAAQGPDRQMIADFWRMVWQQDVRVIVMLINCMEGKKEKCAKYWPDGTSKYGRFTISRTSEEHHPNYTERTFKVTLDTDSVNIKQLHYTTWPDYGVPDSGTILMALRNRMCEIRQKTKPDSTVVVHCSAGVGRTGTLLALDWLMEQANQDARVDVHSCVLQMRHNRINMVQTLAQYMFVHETVLETYKCGVTLLSCVNFAATVAKWKADSTKSVSQFEFLESRKNIPTRQECSVARTAAHQTKNRDNSIIPADSTRVCLSWVPALGNTSEYYNTIAATSDDYINAVFAPGFEKKERFMVTQIPVGQSVFDFWRLVHDFDINTIIMLHDESELKTAECYWDLAKCGCADLVSIKVSSETTTNDIHSRELSYNILAHNKGAQTVKQFMVKQAAWPKDQDLPTAVDLLVRVRDMVKTHQQQTGDHTILVQCMDGATRTGMFCAVYSLLDKMDVHQEVDVFNLIKKLRNNRHQLITTLAQYEFIHDVLCSYLKNFTYADYSNFL